MTPYMTCGTPKYDHSTDMIKSYKQKPKNFANQDLKKEK